MLKKYGFLLPLVPLAIVLIIISNYRFMAWTFPWYAMYDVKRILELALFVVIALILICVPKQRSAWLFTFDQIFPWARMLLLLFLLLGLVSSIFAAVPRYAFLQVAVYFFMFIFALYIAAQRVLYKEKFDKALLTIIFIAIVIYEICFIKANVTAYMVGAPYNPFPGYTNLRFLAQVLAWTLPLTLLPYASEKVKKSLFLKLLFFIIGTLWWMIFFVNQTKGLDLIYIAIVIFMLGYFRGSFFQFFKWLLSFAVTGYVLWFVLFKKGVAIAKQASISQISVGALKSTSFSRFGIWKKFILVIKQKPLFGLGPYHMNFAGNANHMHFIGNPHNSILQIASGWGLPAALLMIALTFVALWFLLRQKKLFATNIALYQVLVFSTLAGLIYSLGSAVIMTPASQIFMSIILGWTFGLVISKNEARPESKKILVGLLFIAILVLFLLLVAVGVYPEIFYMPPLEVKWFVGQGFNKMFTPGFWQQGVFSTKGYLL